MPVSLSKIETDFLAEMKRRFPTKRDRLRDGFYDIKGKDGRQVPFYMNDQQAEFIDNRHGMDLVLKARQLGFTTVIQLDMLDDCLFIDNLSAGVIAHNLTDAKAFFADKIKFAYDNLPEPFRKLRSASQDSADSLRFSNGSSIRVGVSLRSGTLQRLHVSEYGKLCAKYPDRAEEVKTGAFNTVHVGQRITVESTAEGQGGHFHDMVTLARQVQQRGGELTALDFKFHFYPWWTDRGYQLQADVSEPAELTRYFRKLEDQGVVLSQPQRAWYIKKVEQQGEAMKREYPATPDEAFETSIEGAYLGEQMARMRRDGRLCRVPIETGAEVDTFWDLGVNDDMVIWFRQKVGPEHRLIDYYANSGEGLDHYARVLKERAAQRGYVYGTHYLPHDARQRRLGYQARSVADMLPDIGVKPVFVCARIPDERSGVESSRRYLAKCWIDEERCSDGVKCLDNYRREWDDDRAVWKDRPLHNWASHGYKALETAAIAPEYESDVALPADRYRRARSRAEDSLWAA